LNPTTSTTSVASTSTVLAQNCNSLTLFQMNLDVIFLNGGNGGNNPQACINCHVNGRGGFTINAQMTPAQRCTESKRTAARFNRANPAVSRIYTKPFNSDADNPHGGGLQINAAEAAGFLQWINAEIAGE